MEREGVVKDRVLRLVPMTAQARSTSGGVCHALHFVCLQGRQETRKGARGGGVADLSP